jgi:hypothetical protein
VYRKEETVKRVTILIIIVFALSSCTTFQKPVTLNQVKSGLDCVQYKEGMSWNQVSQVMDSPDIAPIPDLGTDLSKNTRIYKEKIVIFYTGMKEVKEEGKVRFREVVNGIEFCKKK